MCQSAENNFPRIWNYADSDGKTGTGGNFRLSHSATQHIRTTQLITQNTNYMTAAMYKVTGLTCSFVYGIGLQPVGINQLVTPLTFYFSTCDP